MAGLVLNTNIASLESQNSLRQTNSEMTDLMIAMSTGKSINSASDDAAGLAIVNEMSRLIAGTEQGIDNANQALDLVATAEGAMDQIYDNLIRMEELAVQSANGTYSDEQRELMQLEMDELAAETQRIVDGTQFNGTKILSGGYSATMQIGADNSAANQITVTIPDMASLNVLSGNGVGGAIGFDISTQGAAQSALTMIKEDILTVSQGLASLGAQTNRLESAVNVQTSYSLSMQNSRSTIEDLDYAEASSDMAMLSVKYQAGLSSLVQANALPQGILTLL